MRNKRMKKNIPLYVRLDQEQKRMFDRLTATTVRTQQDMVRFLIVEKYIELFGTADVTDEEKAATAA